MTGPMSCPRCTGTLMENDEGDPYCLSCGAVILNQAQRRRNAAGIIERTRGGRMPGRHDGRRLYRRT